MEALEDRLAPATLSTIASFNPYPSGETPKSNVVFDSQGDLFGTTYNGGYYGAGTVYEIVHGTNTITTVANFDNVHGAHPTGDVVLDDNGNLFGTTSGGGANQVGTIFEIVKGTSAITTIASFNAVNGADPVSGVVLDGHGNLYGTTSQGGQGSSVGYGTIFEIRKGTNTIATLASFNRSNGANPSGRIAFDQFGNLFGTALSGGAANDGTVFELAKGANTVTTIVSFSGTNAANPDGGLVIDMQGNMYGTTNSGGAN